METLGDIVADRGEISSTTHQPRPGQKGNPVQRTRSPRQTGNPVRRTRSDARYRRQRDGISRVEFGISETSREYSTQKWNADYTKMGKQLRNLIAFINRYTHGDPVILREVMVVGFLCAGKFTSDYLIHTTLFVQKN